MHVCCIYKKNCLNSSFFSFFLVLLGFFFELHTQGLVAGRKTMGVALQAGIVSLPGDNLSDSDAGDGIDDRCPDRENGY